MPDRVGWLTHWARQGEAATAGPWEFFSSDDVAAWGIYGDGWLIASTDPGPATKSDAPLLATDFRTPEVADANGEFIAASRSVAGPLLELVTRCERWATATLTVYPDNADAAALVADLRAALGGSGTTDG